MEFITSTCRCQQRPYGHRAEAFQIVICAPCIASRERGEIHSAAHLSYFRRLAKGNMNYVLEMPARGRAAIPEVGLQT